MAYQPLDDADVVSIHESDPKAAEGLTAAQAAANLKKWGRNEIPEEKERMAARPRKLRARALGRKLTARLRAPAPAQPCGRCSPCSSSARCPQ